MSAPTLPKLPDPSQMGSGNSVDQKDAPIISAPSSTKTNITPKTIQVPNSSDSVQAQGTPQVLDPGAGGGGTPATTPTTVTNSTSTSQATTSAATGSTSTVNYNQNNSTNNYVAPGQSGSGSSGYTGGVSSPTIQFGVSYVGTYEGFDYDLNPASSTAAEMGYFPTITEGFGSGKAHAIDNAAYWVLNNSSIDRDAKEEILDSLGYNIKPNFLACESCGTASLPDTIEASDSEFGIVAQRYIPSGSVYYRGLPTVPGYNDGYSGGRLAPPGPVTPAIRAQFILPPTYSRLNTIGPFTKGTGANFQRLAIPYKVPILNVSAAGNSRAMNPGYETRMGNFLAAHGKGRVIMNNLSDTNLPGKNWVKVEVIIPDPITGSPIKYHYTYNTSTNQYTDLKVKTK